MDRLNNIGSDTSPKNFAEPGLSNDEGNTFVSASTEMPETPELSAKKEEIQEELKKSQEEREEKDKEVAEQLIVINGAKIKFNSHMGEFKVLTDVPTTQDKLTGTIVEKQIPNFTFYDGFQMIALTNWVDFGTVKIQENDVLIKKSKLPSVGKLPGNIPPESGNIEFIDSGQIHAPESINTTGAPVPDEKEDDGLYNDYQLLRNGTIKFIKDRTKDIDVLFASDKNNKIDTTKSIKIKKENYKSILNQLASISIPDYTKRYDNGKKAFSLGVNRARTTSDSAIAKTFVFVANNSDVEWGLAGYNMKNNMTYALWTGHSEDITPNSILYQGISKLSFEIHSHPGGRTDPSPVNGFTEGDYGAAAWVDSNFAKNKNYPRHFVYSKQGKHLWEYHYYNETSSKFYPGNSSVNKPMPVGNTINLKTLRK